MHMPMSPSPIPRSSSYPNLSSSASTSAIRASNRSVCSSARSSAKFSYWRHWSNINLLGNLIIAGREKSESDLTEGSLEAHNRRLSAPTVTHHERINAINVGEKNSKCSPYYKGLTDASLVINRSRSSPGRESHHAATSVTTSTSSTLSSVIIKMQEWSSCITFQFRGDHINHTASATNSSSIDHNVNNGKKNTAAAETTLGNEKEAVIALLNDRNKEKPLRESTISSVTSESSSSSTVKVDENIKKEKEREFIWATKYQPTVLKDFICNRDKAIQLQGLVTKEEGCGNFIFEGPPGVGKRTMIMALLRQAFGPDLVLQVRQVCKVFDLKGEMIGNIKVNVKESSQHIEVNVSDLKGYEKHVIIELMKESQSKIESIIHDSCRAIILCEADKLSTDALLYIRWILEKYKGLNNVFFCCTDVSKLQPIKSLCTLVQLFPPSKQEIVQVVEFIAKQQGIELPHKFAEKIAENSKNNLRQAIRSFEASWQMSYPFEEDEAILTGWEDDITNIAKKIIEEQSPKQLYIIRGKLQNLIEHDVSLDFIFKVQTFCPYEWSQVVIDSLLIICTIDLQSLVGELKKHLDVGLHRQIDCLYDEYNRDDGSMFENEKPLVFARSRHEEVGKRQNEHMRKNVQLFLRIEEFIAKFMSWYKTVTNNNNRYEQEQHDTAHAGT
ncbi:hypothetical protein Ddye_018421 [Dipteronia dyeriana]|uniref:Replication factor C subunit 3 n=1 Tax=Dipteronia dyeriana TaxID=168575 RepID=A0AAD9UAK7_9ROSI|nr:hypothetical protein Ddye_018421 [Dipteronia dyeriana]